MSFLKSDVKKIGLKYNSSEQIFFYNKKFFVYKQLPLKNPTQIVFFLIRLHFRLCTICQKKSYVTIMCVYEFVVYYMYKLLLHAVWNKRDST